MNIFVDYLQPLTHWLQANPHWALFFTFIISLAESLAIIGSIVPGSVTMTAIGILAGSGIMRIDLTLLAAILGAVVGDSLSYALGFYFSDRLVDIWPFSRYPRWLQYGREFFAVHGAKSVLIGRFVGPLRSIIPVIAGILHMKQWRFLIANVLSAIGWAFLYVMPGVLIGAASHELSTESASRLFVMILILLVALWLFGVLLKWVFRLFNHFLVQNLQIFWIKMLHSPLSNFVRSITPAEQNHHYTALLFLSMVLNLFFFTVLLILTCKGGISFNLPIHLFVQSFHTHSLEAFSIFCTQLTSKWSILTIFCLACMWFIFHRQFRELRFIISLMIIALVSGFFLNQIVFHPRPNGVLVSMTGSAFRAMNLLVATAFYRFIFFYIENVYSIITHSIRTLIYSVLALSGLGSLYLGDFWLSDILAGYFAGSTLALIYCLYYRKHYLATSKTDPATFGVLMLGGLLLATTLSTYFNFRTLAYNHTPYYAEFTISKENWWNQNKPTLPLYRLNRLGKKISLFNIQYSGDPNLLQEMLKQQGWKAQEESFFSNLIFWLNHHQAEGSKLPPLTQLYENKAPRLTMHFKSPDKRIYLELRLWESNFNLQETNNPLWIGSIHPRTPYNRKDKDNANYYPKLLNPTEYLPQKSTLLKIKVLTLPEQVTQPTIFPTQPMIVLIREKNEVK